MIADAENTDPCACKLAPISRCIMSLLCENCKFTSNFVDMGSMSIEECNQKCLEDETCFGVDYGYDSSYVYHCYHHFGNSQDTHTHDYLYAWSKTCGKRKLYKPT